MATHHICRLCMGKSDLVNIFTEKDDSGITLEDKIFYVLGIKVLRNDGRATVCHPCRSKVVNFYSYKVMVENTEEKFGAKFKPQDIKIKTEPVDGTEDPSNSSSSPNNVKYGVGSFGANFPNGVFVPPFYTMDRTGNVIMVPLGGPIPLSSLNSTNMGSVPVLGHFPPDTSNKGKSPSAAADSSSGPKIEPSESEKKEHFDEPPVLTREVQSTCDGRSSPSTSQLPNPESESASSSDDLNTVDDIINQVQTDKEDSTEDKEVKEGDKEVQESHKEVKEKAKEQQTSPKGLKGVSPVAAVTSRSSPMSARGRRGRKRRGSSLSAPDSSKRRRSKRVEDTPKSTPGRENSQIRRLTRSSTGSRPRSTRKIVDSSSDDGDFNADDPDDPDDPAFSVPRKKGYTASSSSSSSDTETPKQVTSKKVTPVTPKQVPLVSSKIQKDEATMRTCPHCDLTYKHWVSYDDHVKGCEDQKRIEKEKKEKEKPEEKVEEDDLTDIKCIICLKFFQGRKALKEHMSVHQPKKGPPYECKICHETFTEKGGLICHNALRHRSNITEPILKPERKKLHCIDCDEHFQNSGDYICHQVLFHKKK